MSSELVFYLWLIGAPALMVGVYAYLLWRDRWALGFGFVVAWWVAWAIAALVLEAKGYQVPEPLR